jgi:cell division protein FtsB
MGARSAAAGDRSEQAGGRRRTTGSSAPSRASKKPSTTRGATDARPPKTSRRAAKGDGTDDAGATSSRTRHPLLFGVWVGLVAVVALALILFLVLPTRTWLSQRSSLSDSRHRLSVLQQENDALSARVTALQSPEEVERVARQQYGMVRPGEQPFAVAAPTSPAGLPAAWPYTIVQGILSARTASAGPATTTGH